ncbi:hypothetical protein JTE90_009290 [Oedothorax gibbosus]|uniref:Uncharacterized protein n=1 Tax=Oedothorax gibbosus TaxID=931172 RepID=A0AAV6TS07_9ARAC|nr:hypothetical protein JTE90_009290 [Oedothorax gibbosus]
MSLLQKSWFQTLEGHKGINLEPCQIEVRGIVKGSAHVFERVSLLLKSDAKEFEVKLLIGSWELSGNYDAILGMDFLYRYRAEIDCVSSRLHIGKWSIPWKELDARDCPSNLVKVDGVLRAEVAEHCQNPT